MADKFKAKLIYIKVSLSFIVRSYLKEIKYNRKSSVSTLLKTLRALHSHAQAHTQINIENNKYHLVREHSSWGLLVLPAIL